MLLMEIYDEKVKDKEEIVINIRKNLRLTEKEVKSQKVSALKKG